jgi:hypothetical protein
MNIRGGPTVRCATDMFEGRAVLAAALRMTVNGRVVLELC